MSQACIERFVDALWIEDGLSALTLAAYRRDLELYAAWLARSHARAIDATREGDLLEYRVLRHRASKFGVLRDQPGLGLLCARAAHDVLWAAIGRAHGGHPAGQRLEGGQALKLGF